MEIEGPASSRPSGSCWRCRSRRCGRSTSTTPGLSPIKREAIDELGMGTNSKVLMQFDRRPQHYGRWSGNLTTDTPFEYTWDTSVTQPGRAGPDHRLLGRRQRHRLRLRRRTRAGPRRRGLRDPARRWSRRPRRGSRRASTATPSSTSGPPIPGRAGSYAAFEPGQTSRYSREIRKPEGGHPLRRRAHLDRLPGVPGGRGRVGRARGGGGRAQPLGLDRPRPRSARGSASTRSIQATTRGCQSPGSWWSASIRWNGSSSPGSRLEGRVLDERERGEVGRADPVAHQVVAAVEQRLEDVEAGLDQRHPGASTAAGSGAAALELGLELVGGRLPDAVEPVEEELHLGAPGRIGRETAAARGGAARGSAGSAVSRRRPRRPAEITGTSPWPGDPLDLGAVVVVDDHGLDLEALERRAPARPARSWWSSRRGRDGSRRAAYVFGGDPG